MVGDRVYVTLFHKEDVVVLEDRAGNRYVKSVPMNLEKLLDKERCMALTLNLLGKDQEEKSIIPVPKPALPLSFAKYLWEQTREHKKMTELMALAGEELIASNKLTTAYRREVYKSLLTYYMDCGDTRRMDHCLEKLIRKSWMGRRDGWQWKPLQAGECGKRHMSGWQNMAPRRQRKESCFGFWMIGWREREQRMSPFFWKAVCMHLERKAMTAWCFPIWQSISWD